MQELDVISFTNPSSEDFTHRFNGQPFTVRAGETTSLTGAVAYHLAKHLSTKMIVDEVMGKLSEKEVADPKSSIHAKVSQLNSYDTPERRIALFKILKDENRVLEVIMRYPFKGFIGEMDTYRKFVEKGSKQKEKVAELK